LLPAPQSTATLRAAGQCRRNAPNAASPARCMSVSPGIPARSIAWRSMARTDAAE
jgi:hypothetical protein